MCVWASNIITHYLFINIMQLLEAGVHLSCGHPPDTFESGQIIVAGPHSEPDPLGDIHLAEEGRFATVPRDMTISFLRACWVSRVPLLHTYTHTRVGADMHTHIIHTRAYMYACTHTHTNEHTNEHLDTHGPVVTVFTTNTGGGEVRVRLSVWRLW